MNKERKNEPVRMDLGKGWMIESDRPPANIIKALRRCDRLMKAGRYVTTRRDREAFFTLRNWLEEQWDEHGGVKPASEQPAAQTIGVTE
jgi:hypothetical protein